MGKSEVTETVVKLYLKCPYCLQYGFYPVDISGKEFIVNGNYNLYNLDEHVFSCSRCGESDFLVHVFVSFKQKVTIRKIDPPNFYCVDEGDCIIDKDGHIKEK